MKHFQFIIFLLLFTTLKAQLNTDSLEKQLNKSGNDTASILKLITDADGYTNTDINAANSYYTAALNKAIAGKHTLLQAKIYTHIGKIQIMKSEHADASASYLQAITLAEKLNNQSILANAYMGLGNIGVMNKEFAKSKEYFEKALTNINDTDITLKSKGLSSMASVYYLQSYKSERFTDINNRTDTQMLTTSLRYSLLSYNLLQHRKINPIYSKVLGNLAITYIDLGKLDSATFYLKLLREELDINPNPNHELHYLSNMGRINRAKLQYPNAIKYYEEARTVAENFGEPSWIYDTYIALAETYEVAGRYKEAINYYVLYKNYKDSTVEQENFQIANDLQTKYESEKKEKQLIQLNASNDKKSTLIKIFAGSAAGILLLSIFGYRNFKQRSRIAEQEKHLQLQQIKQLQDEKKLLAVDAMFKGQEEERSRIAKDLHDGLGGLLAGTKLSFMNIRQKVNLNEENAAQFDNSLGMLDNTIGDLRKTAHNLMPEALVKFGLYDALKDFCHRMESSSQIAINFSTYGQRKDYSNTASVFIYRIVQELVNNAVKHAGAKNILVQVTTTEDETGITVEDDGKGFDVTAASKGAGMENIQYRAHYFNGTVDIVSKENEGTSATINLKV